MIVIVSPTESNITKRGKRHPNLSEYLIKKGESVLYVTSTFYHAEKRIFSKSEIDAGRESAPYEIIYLNAGKYTKNISIKRTIWSIRFAIKVWLCLKNRIDSNCVVILPSRPPELLLIARLLKLSTNCKLIVDVLDVWPDAFLVNNKLLRLLFTIYCNIFNYSGLKAFDKAFYVSRNFLNWINRYNKKIHSVFIPIGIEEKYIVKKFQFIDKVSEKIIIIHIGSLQFQLDLLPLCKAINMDKEKYRLIIVGENGSGQRYNEVKSFLDAHSIDYTIFGFLPREKVFEQLQNSHISVIPMISGGLPKKFFDSMGAGKPVLVLGEGGSAEEVRLNDVGWITDFNPDNIFTTLKNINKETINNKIQNISKSINDYRELNSMEKMYKEIKTLLVK